MPPALDMQISESEDFSMRNKRIVTILLAAVLLLCVVFTAAPKAQAAGNYTIRLADSAGNNTVTAKPGDTVKLILSIENNPGIICVGAKLAYPSVLSLTAKPTLNMMGLAMANTSFSDGSSKNATDNPYLVCLNMATGTVDNKLVTFNGKIAEMTFKVAADAQAGDYKITLTAPADKNTTAQVDGGGVIKPNTNTDITNISLINCTIKVESTCSTQGHSYGSWQKVDDNKHKRVCSVCNTPEEKDHTWDSGKVEQKPSCKQTGTTVYTCTATGCGATKTVHPGKTAHSYGAWQKVDDNKHTHTCSVCNAPETKDHTWNSGSVTKKATCKEEGVKTYTCTACNAKKTEPIKKLTTHTYDNNCDADCNVCSATRSVTHKYKTSWSKNKKEHWHVCSVCGDKKDVAAHIPGPEATEKNAQKCTECGYTIKAALSHKCEFADTWTTDETGHWYACAGCEEQNSYAEHDFENACDPDCSICGYQRETAHKYAEAYSSDKTNHWYECTGCGDKQEIATHEPGAAATETTAQTCTICGYEIAPALGGSTEPTTEPTEDTTTPTDNEEMPTGPKIEIPWGIVFAAVGAVTLILVIILLTKKKNRPMM